MLHNNIYLASQEQPWLFRWASRPFSLLYQLVLSIRNEAYDRGLLKAASLPGHCISVGNISVGGTGKSPVVMAMAKLILEKGGRPAILTRAYGSSLGKNGMAMLLAGKVVSIKNATTVRFADEAMMQSQSLPQVPVILGARRLQAARWYLANIKDKPSHWLLDDGFQHRKIARDLDVVLLDADEPFGNGKLLPAGSLRESLQALNRAHVILLTRSKSEDLAASFVKQVKGKIKAPIFSVPFKSSLPRGLTDKQPGILELMEKKAPMLLVTGIARPGNLIADLEVLGVLVEESYIVRDHQPLSKETLMAKIAQRQAVVTTAKDYWRDPTIFSDFPIPVFLAQIEPQIPHEALVRHLDLKN